MESEKPATDPNVVASPLGDATVAAPPKTWVGRLPAPEPRVQRKLSSPKFSIATGILAPIACFVLEPIVLSDALDMPPPLRMINELWLLGYGIIGLEMLVLALRLAYGARLGAANGPIAGVLFAGALFVGGLGLFLLPFSLIGLVVLIGALGFVPLLTAFVYFANAAAAYRDARQVKEGAKPLASALLGALLAIGVPVTAQATVALAVQSAIRDVAAGKSGALARLRTWHRFAPRDSLVWSYASEPDPVRRQRLAEAYNELTGEDVESRLARLAD